jgi:amino acid transporter
MSQTAISSQEVQLPADQTLKRKLTVFDSVCIVVGSVIGSGIFVSPTRVFSLLNQSPLLSLGAWLIAALISIAGALCYAELGCMFPKAGGEYEYLKKGIGRFWGFIYTWAQMIVFGTGSIAIMATVSSTYLVQAILGSSANNDILIKAGASILVIALTIVNCLGIESGSKIQNILTVIKMFSIVFLIGLGIFSFSSLNFAHLFHSAGSSTSTADHPSFWDMNFRWGGALIACLWAYDGWNNLSKVTEEAVNVEKTLPRSLIIGVLLVTVAYLSLNCLYFLILSPAQILESKAIALSALSSLGDKVPWIKAIGASFIIGLIVAFSASGATNGSILAWARTYFAAARDGLFFEAFGHTNNKTKAPILALSFQGVWSVVLICLGNFESLLDYFSFSMWIFYGACAAILISFRLTKPDLPRPYKVWLYPITPIVFLLAAIYLVIGQIVNAPLPSTLSLLGVFSGAVFYLPLIKKNSKA